MNAKLILTNVIGHMEFVLIRSEVTDATVKLGSEETEEIVEVIG